MHHVQTFCKIPFTTKRSSPPRTLVPHRHRKIRVLPPLPQQVPHRRSCVSTLTQNRCSRHKQRVRMQQTHNSVKMYHLSKDPCANLLVLVLICGAGISAGRNTDKHTHTHTQKVLWTKRWRCAHVRFFLRERVVSIHDSMPTSVAAPSLHLCSSTRRISQLHTHAIAGVQADFVLGIHATHRRTSACHSAHSNNNADVQADMCARLR